MPMLNYPPVILNHANRADETFSIDNKQILVFHDPEEAKIHLERMSFIKTNAKVPADRLMRQECHFDQRILKEQLLHAASSISG
jgi:hypothetical protein